MAGKVIVVANWKMNPATFREAKKLYEATRRAVEHTKNVSVIIAPPAIFVHELSVPRRGSKVSFALQNIHADSGGAHTGEISIAQGKDSRVGYCLVGHAERRAMGETNDDTRKKVRTALAGSLVPILCVGESRRTEGGEQYEVVRDQLRAGLSDVPAAKLKKVIVTYEPLWTIGAASTMAPRDMHGMAIFMQKCVVDSHGEAGRALKILYGGSVDEKNAPVMLHEGQVHGFLVGRASIKPQEFAALLHAIDVV